MSVHPAVTFLNKVFLPGDRICLAAKKTDSTVFNTSFKTLEEACSEETLDTLSAVNDGGANIYVCMNAIIEGHNRRRKVDIGEIRSAYLDIDKDGKAKLDAILADQSVPTPIVLESSPEKFQAIWPIQGIAKEQQEALLDTLIAKFGGDPAASDCSRVLRLPGFVNAKYSDGPLVKLISEGGDKSPYSLEDFKVEVKPSVAPKPFEVYGIEVDGPEIPLHEHDVTLHSIAGKLRSMGEQWDETAIYDRLFAICEKRIPTRGSDWIDMVAKHAKRIAEKPAGVEETFLIDGKKPGESVAPIIANPIDPNTLPNRTERGNGIRFIAKCNNNIRFNYEKKTWLHWNDFIWVEDDQSFVTAKMKSIADDIIRESDSIQDKDTRKMFSKWGLRTESRNVVSNSLFMAQSEPGVAVKLNMFDSIETDFLFNTKSRTLDLRNNQTYEPKKEDYITKSSSVAYDKNAKCPRFEVFLEEVLPDPEVRSYIQRAAGLSLSGFTGEHALFLLYGTGRNGKSTLVDILRYVLGDYATQSDWSSFTEGKYGSGAVNNDIARLRGARFVSASESAANAKLAEGVIKNITGGEAVQARFLFQEFFEFVPKFKLWLTTNHKPRIIGTDPAIWSRVNLINFGVQVPIEKRDHELPKKLREEAAGILNWMLAGFHEWDKQGLNPPAAVKAATEEYRQDSDTVSRFLEDRCEMSPDYNTPTTEIYNAYRQWIVESGETFTCTSKQLKESLESRPGVKYRRTMDSRLWIGLRIRRGILGSTLPAMSAASSESEELPF